ncbi:hypothetical protein MOO45_04880 [Bombilactobacillus folatiphilus]|uniref:Uncharacterized protein n=1 Tax=Bombilactobacillus folatiphilus TaxID=2923362 RepID=A0ABY4P7H4_9LACO|nr:hypothetical protein [Bombilactobacillus folatiphilus]UQS81562.1 hypothetical protein MOO45_04880 [Bombilactobacillus folatiphilus]
MSQKPYSDDRWQGKPDELKLVKRETTPKIEAKHKAFMAEFRRTHGLDENGNELPKKQE